jgi:preprotein translocase subunit SecF
MFLSLLACIASLYLTVWPLTPPCGGLNCGVDFKGGSLIEFSTDPRPLDIGLIRAPLNDLGIGEVQVQGFADGTSAMARYETPEGADADATLARVQETIRQQLGQDVEFGRREVVGPKVSGELFRFGFTFGAAAVIALAHDVVLTFGLFAITRMEFTLVAVGSILTIIGYSINDKIVVLDRVRENLRKYKRMPMKELIDLSVNETLSRTIITGVTGLMALGVMAYYGGEALFAFAVSMFFGIVVGTYSSIFIAAPALTFFGVGRRDDFKSAAEKKKAKREGEAPSMP